MGLLNYVFRRRNERINERVKEGVEELENKETGGKIFRTINTICILIIFAVIALVSLAITRLLDFSPKTIGSICTLGVISMGMGLMLPWIRFIEQKKHKTLSIVFICLDSVVPILWIIAIWTLILNTGDGSNIANTLNFVKSVMVISLQFAVVSFITNGIIKHGKKLLIFQIIGYVSYVYFDFYISYALCCISFNDVDGISISGALTVLGNKVMLSLFVISLMYVILSYAILGRYRRKRYVADDVVNMFPGYEDEFEKKPEQKTEEKSTQPEKSTQSVEKQMEKLKELLDKDLITQEEYDKKRQDIIDKL